MRLIHGSVRPHRRSFDHKLNVWLGWVSGAGRPNHAGKVVSECWCGFRFDLDGCLIGFHFQVSAPVSPAQDRNFRSHIFVDKTASSIPKAQNSPKSLHNMVFGFGPKKLKT